MWLYTLISQPKLAIDILLEGLAQKKIIFMII